MGALDLVAVGLSAAGLARMWLLLGTFTRRNRLQGMAYPLSQALLVACAVMGRAFFGLGMAYSVVACAMAAIGLVLVPRLFRMLEQAQRSYPEMVRRRVLTEQLQWQRERLERARAEEEAGAEKRARLVAAFRQVEEALAQGDVELARALLADAAGEVRPAAESLCPGNAALDALLSAKTAACRERGIELRVHVGLPEGEIVTDVELCALFGNVLDNAIDACATLGEGARWIELRSFSRAGYYVVDARNPYDSVAAAPTRARGVASGGVSRDHGHGLGILRAVAERHGGELVCEQRDGIWRTTVLIAR